MKIELSRGDTLHIRSKNSIHNLNISVDKYDDLEVLRGVNVDIIEKLEKEKQKKSKSI